MLDSRRYLFRNTLKSAGHVYKRSFRQTKESGQRVRFPHMSMCNADCSALSGPQLIATAHQSLGYQTPTTPLSPEDDSIKAAWRSASQACFDIPDHPSTTTPSPSPGTKRRRMQSCPDMTELKTSPPTPPTSSPAHGRLGPTRAGRQIHQLLSQGDQAGSLPFLARTPLSSPAQGGLGPPLKVLKDRVQVPLPTPPTSSPMGSSRTVIMPYGAHAHTRTQTPHEPSITGNQLITTPPSRTHKPMKPLSLRSRLKMAARRSIVVA